MAGISSTVEDEQVEWVRAHQALSRLAKERAASDALEGRWLLAALRSAAHVHLGFGSFGEYIERLFGYRPRSTQEKLRVAEALEELPGIADALEGGSLNWSCARELTRVAIATTEREWVLGGPCDAGRASYQTVLAVCPDCGAGGQQASGELVPVGAEVVAMADCDGQHLGMLDVLASGSVAANESATANGSDRMNQGAHTGARTKAKANSSRSHAHAGPRAKQTIAPAMRRAVLLRDHHRCTVPGCRNAFFLDLHHIQLSSDGGANETDNLVTLCGVHHRAAHRGQLAISGKVSTGVRFRHADDSDYGHVAEPLVAEARTKAFAALRNLGFREREVRRALAEVSQCGEGRALPLDSVLRHALAILTSPGVAS